MEVVRRDSGLQCLALLLRFHQVSVDPAQIAHQFSGAAIGVTEMQRCAKSLKLKVKATRESWDGLTKLPLPAIVELKDGTFVIAGKVTADDILAQVPSETRPRARRIRIRLDRPRGADGAPRLDVEFGARLFKHLIALPIAYFEVRRAGDSVARSSWPAMSVPASTCSRSATGPANWCSSSARSSPR